ncbi:MAG: putative Zn-dependent peptidase [Acidobacteria bacterium OLB17]|nr:MAG: putative Zn-dependent peptidase [Acidobacteria bacterium OLB17]MCZ2389505.1 insulinase family protein [Acidobacteriota bacterium]
MTRTFPVKSVKFPARSAFFPALLLAVFVLAFGVSAQSGKDEPRTDTLLNGLKMYIWDRTVSPRVEVKLRIHAGASFDPQKKEGVMRLLAENIFPNQATREFFREDLGGDLSISTNYDYIQVTASSTPENMLQMLETIGASVSSMQIDKETTAKLKDALISELKAAEGDEAKAADRIVRSKLFGTFPYGRPVDGTVESVSKIDFADLIDARERFLKADNASIAISGNIDRALTNRAVRRYFGAWQRSDRRIPSTFKQPDPPSPEITTVEWKGGTTAEARTAFRGIAVSDKLAPAAAVYARILEAKLRDRIPEMVAKGVFVRSEPHILPGEFVVGLSTDPNDIGKENGKINSPDLVAKTIAEPISDAEFAKALAAALDAARKRDAMDLWLDVDTYKTAEPKARLDAFAKVTLGDVRDFAKKLQGEPSAVVVLIPPAK